VYKLLKGFYKGGTNCTVGDRLPVEKKGKSLGAGKERELAKDGDEEVPSGRALY
jgi:hypothetical protein